MTNTSKKNFFKKSVAMYVYVTIKILPSNLLLWADDGL